MRLSTALKEEIVNSITHGLGAVLGVAGTAVAIVWAALYGDAYGIVAASVYGAMLIILYTMSTLYHAFTNEMVKKVFRIFDHCSIFLLIAGTYTPFTLVTLRGPFGWALFGIIWGFTVLGIVLNAISLEKFKRFSLVCYIVMGWLIILAAVPMTKALGFMPAMLLLILGGVSYSIGVIFYAMKKVPYMHGVWHLFVLAGSILHYFVILFYVLPVA